MQNKTRILVTGAGGFIGHHLVKRLKADGHWVRGVDIKMPEYEKSAADDFRQLDLRLWENCLEATQDIDQVYNLAADMGGIGYITAFLADISKNNILINAHMLEASKQNDVKRFLFSSSACVYAQSKQLSADVTPLKDKTRIPRSPSRVTAGKNSSPKSSAVTTITTTSSRRASCASTTCTVLSAPTMAARKSLRQQFRAKLRKPLTAARLKSGATAIRHVLTCTWMIAWKA